MLFDQNISKILSLRGEHIMECRVCGKKYRGKKFNGFCAKCYKEVEKLGKSLEIKKWELKFFQSP